MIENHLKTVLLLGLLTGILVGVGSIWGYTGLVIGLVFAVVINFGSYFFSDKIVLAMYRAKEAKEKDYPGLYRVVRDVVHLAKMPMPKVYIVNSANPNAFATGRNPNHSAVAVTTGLMELLERDELK
ncbi:M48 family metalloprotease, partial [archaeon]|nr:M48 family metalloprotease [archaeon]